jgi:hypothetical protein
VWAGEGARAPTNEQCVESNGDIYNEGALTPIDKCRSLTISDV